MALSFTVLHGSLHTANALSHELQASFVRETRTILRRSPRYVWGGSTSEEKGLDCSGGIFLAATRAKIPGISRTTSRNMALGLGGWTGRTVAGLYDWSPGDLVFWTWRNKPERPDGHVGEIHVGLKSGLPEAIHASYSKGRMISSPFRGSMLRDISRIRRLNAGEKHGTR